MLSLAEALERLRSPEALEAFSPLTGDPALIADLDWKGPRPTPDRIAAARVTLAQLPCPTLALCTGEPPAFAADLADRFDVVVRSEIELAPLLTAVECTPLAAMALVQLLRHNEGLDIHEGLVAESLAYSALQGGPEFAAWSAARSSHARSEESPEPAVRVEREGDLLRLTLNRPAKHNAFSAAMRDGLTQGLEVAVCDSSIREVVLRGAGPSFCSGGDLDEFGTFPDPATAHAIRSTRNAARWLAACADRVRAEVHGACIGAGLELCAFARRVVAAEDTFFELPELAIGLVPGAGGTVSLPRRIGRQRTAYLALSGTRLDAQRALSWGLVDELRTPC